jgi:SAM-dependent methyltransferase
LGSGSGRVLIPLAQAGFSVAGLERDADMLTVLRENAPAELLGQMQIFPGDMTGFELGRRFSLILLPCNTYSTLNSQERQQTLACARRHLEPQGLFAASLPNPALLRRLSRHAEPEVEDVFSHPQDGEPVQVSSGWERTSNHLTVTWHYDHLHPDGLVERLSMHARHDLAAVEVYLAELQRSGLEVQAMYGDFDRSSYSPESPNWIFTARQF